MCARSGSLYVRFFPFSEAERHCSGNPDWNEASALDYVRLIVLSRLVCVCCWKYFRKQFSFMSDRRHGGNRATYLFRPCSRNEREREHIVFFIHHTTAAGCQRAQPYQFYGSSAFWWCVGEFWTSSSPSISINVISIGAGTFLQLNFPQVAIVNVLTPQANQTHSLTFNENLQCNSWMLPYGKIN